MLAWQAMHMIKDKQNPLKLSSSEQKRVEKEIQDRHWGSLPSNRPLTKQTMSFSEEK